jgi:predicted transcriptional regulator
MYITTKLDMLEKTVEEALGYRPKIPVFTCTKDEIFINVLTHLSTTRIHRLFVVDEKNRVYGIITIQDIFNWLINE